MESKESQLQLGRGLIPRGVNDNNVRLSLYIDLYSNFK